MHWYIKVEPSACEVQNEPIDVNAVHCFVSMITRTEWTHDVLLSSAHPASHIVVSYFLVQLPCTVWTFYFSVPLSPVHRTSYPAHYEVKMPYCPVLPIFSLYCGHTDTPVFGDVFPDWIHLSPLSP